MPDYKRNKTAVTMPEKAARNMSENVPIITTDTVPHKSARQRDRRWALQTAKTGPENGERQSTSTRRLQMLRLIGQISVYVQTTEYGYHFNNKCCTWKAVAWVQFVGALQIPLVLHSSGLNFQLRVDNQIWLELQLQILHVQDRRVSKICRATTNWPRILH